MDGLSASHAKATSLLAEDKLSEARDVFRTGFLAEIRELYTEAGQTYPLRYQKADCWTTWTKRLYILTRQTEDAFVNGDALAAKELLPQLRTHFLDLHRQAGNRCASDELYAFTALLEQAGPPGDTLRQAMEAVVAAPAPKGDEKATAAFEEARKNWREKAAPLLQATIDDATLRSLRDCTRTFYETYGVRFE